MVIRGARARATKDKDSFPVPGRDDEVARSPVPPVDRPEHAASRPTRPLRFGALFTLFLFLSSILILQPANAQYARIGEDPLVPDTSPSRFLFEELIFSPVSEIPRTDRQFLEPYPGAKQTLYRTEAQNGYLYQLFIHEHQGMYPVYAAGSYVIKRALEDGRFVQVKVFLRNDADFFVRIFPAGSRSRMNVILNGRELYSDIPVPLRFDEVLLLPFEEVVKATRHLVDWDLLRPWGSRAEYAALEAMVRRAREALPNLPDAEDGAMDESGSLVFIETLGTMESLPGFNCSGFAKWVCDGLYAPRRGSYIPLEPLKEKHLELRGTGWTTPREEERDPYFGLDWTRNLGRTIAALGEGVAPQAVHPEAFDVREVPLATYVEDVGYRVEELRHVLYYLAARDPGNFYLASVNREFGEAPVLRQHTHVVVLFPFFREDGGFETVVLERNVETSVASLEGRYSGDYIHLVRVPASADFAPPLFDN